MSSQRSLLRIEYRIRMGTEIELQYRGGYVALVNYGF